MKMGSFSGLGIGLSLVFGCILMGLVAELYYLLWWKKRLAKSNSSSEIKESSLLFCWRKPKSCSSQELREIQDLEIGGSNPKEVGGVKCEEGIEAELMRVHNLCGPPRFLFTIKEESREDLELSEDGRSRKGSRTRSLSDSPPSFDCININPLFETLPEPDLRSSPPPKFKFLRDAEDKLLRRLLQEEAQRRLVAQDSDGSFVKFLNVKNKIHNQVLPLPLPSPPT